MTTFGGDINILKPVPVKLREELRIIAKVAETARMGLPIAEKPGKPGLEALSFFTDAAGASFTIINGEKRFHGNQGKGIACIGGTCTQDIWCWTRLSWPEGLITGMKDEKGCSFGCKSTTLESVGLLLPLIAFPNEVRGKQIVVNIDNIAVMWGWRNGYVRNDESASEILKAAKYLAGYLGTTVFVEHVGRMSVDLASMADELSRRQMCKGSSESEALKKAVFRPIQGSLLKWLENPRMGESLCGMLLKDFGT